MRDPAPENPANDIPVNLRPLALLEALGEAGEALTPTDLGQRLGLPKQTAHRLCRTLVEAGFLERAGAGARVVPGRRLGALSAAMLHGGTHHVARHQILRRLAEALGETVNYAVPETRGMIYRDRVETGWALRVQLPVGSHVPFHCTASGKTWLASLAPAARRRMVAALDLAPLTGRTICEPERLLEHLEGVAAAGYATDDEEFMEGLVALAVPVRDPAGRFIAGLAFHGPRERLPLDRALGEAGRLTEAAAALGALMADTARAQSRP